LPVTLSLGDFIMVTSTSGPWKVEAWSSLV